MNNQASLKRAGSALYSVLSECLEEYDATTAQREAHLLLGHCLGLSQAQVLARLEQELDAADLACLDRLVRRRQAAFPMAYILGRQEFYQHTFAVNPHVLIPRPDTEQLVECALAGERPVHSRVLELGTGSGCVAISLALARPSWKIQATDISAKALAVARENAKHLEASTVRFMVSNWWDRIEDRYDLIVSNPPYLRADAREWTALKHEPARALYGGDDGFCAIKLILANARDYLTRGGWLLIEIGADQANEALALAKQCSYAQTSITKDLAGHHRVLLAQNPS